MSPEEISPQIAAVEKWLGGRWQQNHTATRSDGSQIYVLQRNGGTRDVVVLRNDLNVEGSHELSVPDIGEMCCHTFDEDPALPGLKDIFTSYRNVEVLRYRPGKRVTLAAIDGADRPVIIKCLARNCESVFDRLRAIFPHRSSLRFRVSQPLLLNKSTQILVQSRLTGQPLQPFLTSGGTEYGGSIARAIASLHRSDVVFPERFGLTEQQRRTNRYAEQIRSRIPTLATKVDRVIDLLEKLHSSLAVRQMPLVPIHGSLHSNQWLIEDDDLALVDFDRAAMGHPELDFATFLAEWDYEPEHIAAPVQMEFRFSMPLVDQHLLAFYRSHKHFAKAFKAAKAPDVCLAARKVRRNLDRAARLVVEITQ